MFQYEQLDIMRGRFFPLVRQLPKPGVLDPYVKARLKLLDALTEQGKDILHFEDQIGPFVKKFFPFLLTSNCFVEVKEHDDKEVKTSQPMLINYFLSILLNLIKFNSAYLDADVVSAIITNISEICILDDNIEENIVACLQVISDYLMLKCRIGRSYVKIEPIATYFFSFSFSAWMRFFATLTFQKKLCQLIWKFFASLSTWKDIIKKHGE